MKPANKEKIDKKIRDTLYKWLVLKNFSVVAALIQVVTSTKFISGITISAISTNYLFVIIAAYWLKIPSLFDSVLNRFLCVITISIMGVLFYVLRQKRRMYYAVIEFGAGLGIAFIAVSKLAEDHNTFSALAALLGCIYIIVRACDNAVQARNHKAQ